MRVLWLFLTIVLLSGPHNIFSQPDLTAGPASGPTLTPYKVRAGATASVGSFSVLNLRYVRSWSPGGFVPQAAGAFTVGIYMSTDPIIRAEDDRVLWTGTIDGLDVDETIMIPATSVVIPVETPNGNYFIGVLVDAGNSVVEKLETNNYVARGFRVNAPVNADLTIVSVHPSNKVATVGGTEQSFPSGRLPVAQDGDIYLLYGIKNGGPEASNPCSVGYYVSDDNVYSDDDTYVGEKSFSSVAGGQTRSMSWDEERLPDGVSAGQYFLLLVADYNDDVIEKYSTGPTIDPEKNNVYEVPITVLGRVSDASFVWRAQLRIWTGGGKNDGTNDYVMARLNLDSDGTVLDYARDDFKVGGNDYYDLQLDGVSELRDINRILISKDGSNALCIARMQLLINGVLYFDKDFGGRCDWVEETGGIRSFSGLEIQYAELRRDSHWGSWTLPPSGLTNKDLKSIIQSTIATDMYGGTLLNSTHLGVYMSLHVGAHWGPSVQISRKSNKVLKVNLDLVAEIPGPDPAVDVTFEVVVDCTCEGIGIKLRNLNVDVDSRWYTVINDLILDMIWGHYLEEDLKKRIKKMGQVISLGISCPEILINTRGDIEFNSPVPIRDIALSIATTTPVAMPGHSARIEYTVTNVGNSSVDEDEYVLNVYLASSPTDPLSSATFLSSVSGYDVAPCASEQEKFIRSVHIPSDVSCNRYYFIVELVSGWDENVANNRSSSPVIIEFPELSVSPIPYPTFRQQPDREVEFGNGWQAVNGGSFQADNVVVNIVFTHIATSVSFSRTSGPWTVLPGRAISMPGSFIVPRAFPEGETKVVLSVMQTSGGGECTLENNSRELTFNMPRALN